jgi:hypothetical protein
VKKENAIAIFIFVGWFAFHTELPFNRNRKLITSLKLIWLTDFVKLVPVHIITNRWI